MLIGILSDTHGLLRQEVIDAFKGVDHIIHAGDIDNKAVIDRLEEIAPVTVVRGNADKEWAENLPETAIEEFLGNKIYVIHNKGKIHEDLTRVIYDSFSKLKLSRARYLKKGKRHFLLRFPFSTAARIKPDLPIFLYQAVFMAVSIYDN